MHLAPVSVWRPQLQIACWAVHIEPDLEGQTIWPTRTMCRLLGVSGSGFYDWLGRPASAHERENAALLKAIKDSHEASDGTYGSPRVVRDLIDAGFTCSENRVARSMSAVSLKI